MRSRSWRWFKVRLAALMSRPCNYHWNGHPIPSTRLQKLLWPADSESEREAL